MRFTKMQGAGNDYIYVDCFSIPLPRDPAGLSRAVSDRHFGIGSDGLILICPSEIAEARMRMFNADGSVRPHWRAFPVPLGGVSRVRWCATQLFTTYTSPSLSCSYTGQVRTIHIEGLNSIEKETTPF